MQVPNGQSSLAELAEGIGLWRQVASRSAPDTDLAAPSATQRGEAWGCAPVVQGFALIFDTRDGLS